MAVTADGVVVYRPYQGDPDPAMPDQHWLGQGEGEGDASGGSNSVVFNLKSAAQGLTTELFNIEQISLTILGTSIRAVEVFSGNFDFLNGLPADAQYLGVITTIVTPTQSIGVMDHLKLPAFLGQPRLAGSAAFLQFSATNDNNINMLVTVQGYRWAGGALMVAGGPQRPRNGLYGS